MWFFFTYIYTSSSFQRAYHDSHWGETIHMWALVSFFYLKTRLKQCYANSYSGKDNQMWDLFQNFRTWHIWFPPHEISYRNMIHLRFLCGYICMSFISEGTYLDSHRGQNILLWDLFSFFPQMKAIKDIRELILGKSHIHVRFVYILLQVPPILNSTWDLPLKKNLTNVLFAQLLFHSKAT